MPGKMHAFRARLAPIRLDLLQTRLFARAIVYSFMFVPCTQASIRGAKHPTRIKITYRMQTLTLLSSLRSTSIPISHQPFTFFLSLRLHSFPPLTSHITGVHGSEGPVTLGQVFCR